MKGVFLCFIIQKEFLKRTGGWRKKPSFINPRTWLTCSGGGGVFYPGKTSLSVCISSQATVAPVQGGENLLRISLGRQAELGGPGCVGGVGRVPGNEVSPSAQGTGHVSVRGTKLRLVLKCTVLPYPANMGGFAWDCCGGNMWAAFILLLSHFNLAQNKTLKYAWDIAQLEDVTCLSIQTKVIMKVDACAQTDLTSLFWRQTHILHHKLNLEKIADSLFVHRNNSIFPLMNFTIMNHFPC